MEFKEECERRVKSIAQEIQDIYEGEAIDEDGNQIDFFDYFDEVYDVKYVIDSNLEYVGAEIAVAIGGPNIYVKTRNAMVELYWGCDTAKWPITYSASDEIDAIFGEMYETRRL